MINQFNTVTLSNSSIVFYGKKSDLKVYSHSCKNFFDDRISDEEPVLSYHIYMDDTVEVMESFRILMGASNVSSSGGIIIPVQI